MKTSCNISQLLEPKNMTSNSVDLYIYGDIISHEKRDWDGNAIVDEDTYPAEIRSFLDAANGRDINIYINSGGGSVYAGQAIASMLQRYEGKTHAQIDGLCASIATSIALSCDTTTITENGLFMYHKSWIPLYTSGNTKQLMEAAKKACDLLDTIDTSMLAIYEKHATNEEAFSTIKKNFNNGKDTWLTADETCSFFNIQKSEKATVAYAKSKFLDMSNAPKVLQKIEEPKNNLEEKYKFIF